MQRDPQARLRHPVAPILPGAISIYKKSLVGAACVHRAFRPRSNLVVGLVIAVLEKVQVLKSLWLLVGRCLGICWCCPPKPPRPGPPRPGPRNPPRPRAVACCGDGEFGSGGRVARACRRSSKARGEAEAVASRGGASKPNIATENRQGVAGRPPISNRPASSVTVTIFSLLPQLATTVAPGIGWPPEVTDPFCVSPRARPTTAKTKPVVRSILTNSPYYNDDRPGESSLYFFYCAFFAVIVTGPRPPSRVNSIASAPTLPVYVNLFGVPSRPWTVCVKVIVSPVTFPSAIGVSPWAVVMVPVNVPPAALRLKVIG